MTGRKRLLLLVSLVALVAIAPGVALADPPPGPYFNGFETNTAGWSNFGGGTIRREPSGYTNSGGYAERDPVGERFLAREAGQGPKPPTCQSGGRTAACLHRSHHELGRLQLDLPDRWIHHPSRHLPRRAVGGHAPRPAIRLVVRDQRHVRSASTRLRLQCGHRALGVRDLGEQQRDPMRRNPPRTRAYPRSRDHLRLVHVRARVHRCSRWPAHRHAAADPQVVEHHARDVDP